MKSTGYRSKQAHTGAWWNVKDDGYSGSGEYVLVDADGNELESFSANSEMGYDGFYDMLSDAYDDGEYRLVKRAFNPDNENTVVIKSDSRVTIFGIYDPSDGGWWGYAVLDSYGNLAFESECDYESLGEAEQFALGWYDEFGDKLASGKKSASLYPGIKADMRIYDALAEYYPEELEFIEGDFPKDMTFIDFMDITFDIKPEMPSVEILGTGDSDTEAKIAWMFAEACGWDEQTAYDFVRFGELPPEGYFASAKRARLLVASSSQRHIAFDSSDQGIDWDACISIVSESISHDYDRGYNVFCEYMRRYYPNYPDTGEWSDMHREDAANAAYVLSVGEMDWYLDTAVRDDIFDCAAWYLEEHGMAIPRKAATARRKRAAKDKTASSLVPPADLGKWYWDSYAADDGYECYTWAPEGYEGDVWFQIDNALGYWSWCIDWAAPSPPNIEPENRATCTHDALVDCINWARSHVQQLEELLP